MNIETFTKAYCAWAKLQPGPTYEELTEDVPKHTEPEPTKVRHRRSPWPAHCHLPAVYVGGGD